MFANVFFFPLSIYLEKCFVYIELMEYLLWCLFAHARERATKARKGWYAIIEHMTFEFEKDVRSVPNIWQFETAIKKNLLTWTRDSGNLIWMATSSRANMSGYRVFMNSVSSMSNWARVKVVRSRRCFLGLTPAKPKKRRESHN